MLREKMESHKMLNLKSKEGRKGMEFKKKKKEDKGNEWKTDTNALANMGSRGV